jgi:hypothetical protein
LRNREEKKKSRDRKKERSFSNAILAFIELWITIIGSKCHLLKITIPRERNVERGKDERKWHTMTNLDIDRKTERQTQGWNSFIKLR